MVDCWLYRLTQRLVFQFEHYRSQYHKEECGGIPKCLRRLPSVKEYQQQYQYTHCSTHPPDGDGEGYELWQEIGDEDANQEGNDVAHAAYDAVSF